MFLGYALGLSAIFPATSQIIADLSKVNSAYDEQHPVFSSFGHLYLTMAYHPDNQGGSTDPGDVWMSEGNSNREFQKPVRVNGLSTSGYDVLVGFLEDNTILVYHDGKGKSQGIHQYSGSGLLWTHEKQLDLGSFRNQSPHFSGRLSVSKDILILSLASFGSYGNEDIYVSFLQENGNWSSPQNLGPHINTYQQEMTPSFSVDTRILFFSSNGHGSNGGVDVFYSERLDDSWENWGVPQSLTKENTKGVELSYFTLPGDTERAIFTSTQNSEGYGDIHLIQAEALVLTEENLDALEDKLGENRIIAPEKEPSLPSQATAKVVTGKGVQQIKEDTSSIEAQMEDPVGNSYQTPREGSDSPANVSLELQGFDLNVLDINTLSKIGFSISLLDGAGVKSPKIVDESIHQIDLSNVKEITISSEGYLPLTLKVVPDTSLPDPILLTPVSKGLSMVLEQVLFKRGTADLLEGESAAFLTSMADFLNENPDVKILLEGHTDNVGNVVLNKELSLERASTIRDFLVNQGVDFERIRVNGWGGSKPISSNQNEEGRTKNRRVEMVIL